MVGKFTSLLSLALMCFLNLGAKADWSYEEDENPYLKTTTYIARGAENGLTVSVICRGRERLVRIFVGSEINYAPSRLTTKDHLKRLGGIDIKFRFDSNKTVTKTFQWAPDFFSAQLPFPWAKSRLATIKFAKILAAHKIVLVELPGDIARSLSLSGSSKPIKNVLSGCRKLAI